MSFEEKENGFIAIGIVFWIVFIALIYGGYELLKSQIIHETIPKENKRTEIRVPGKRTDEQNKQRNGFYIYRFGKGSNIK